MKFEIYLIFLIQFSKFLIKFENSKLKKLTVLKEINKNTDFS